MSSLRARLLASLLVTLAIGGLLMGYAAYSTVLRETKALFDYQLRQMALSLRNQGEIAPAQADAFVDTEFDFVVQIWTVDGRTIYTSRPHSELPTRAVLGFADIATRGGTWRTYSVVTPQRVIQVAQPNQIRQHLAAQAALRSALPLLVVAPLMAALGWWLVALAFAPLHRVAGDVRTRDAESLAPLPLSGLPDEVSPLVHALNSLLQRLSISFGAQRAFVSDAAHELRSPLTALRLQIERLRRLQGTAERELALDALSAGTERAVRLVEQLLTLARSEPGAQTLNKERIDLSEVVRQAVADTVPYAASKGTEIALEAQEGLQICADAAALTALGRNLVDNAVRYSPISSLVQVALSADQDVPMLCVDDAGPGVPLADRARVFDRFFRRDQGPLDETTQGSGLGLAIVRSVAERHGASVSLEDSPLGGLRVIVRFGDRTAPTQVMS